MHVSPATMTARITTPSLLTTADQGLNAPDVSSLSGNQFDARLLRGSPTKSTEALPSRSCRTHGSAALRPVTDLSAGEYLAVIGQDLIGTPCERIASAKPSQTGLVRSRTINLADTQNRE